MNGAIGFAVFDAHTGRRLFRDSAAGAIELLERGQTLGLRYVSAFTASCSMLTDEGCWAAIAAQTGIPGAAPDCARGYREDRAFRAGLRCEGASNSDECVEKAMKDLEEYDASPSMIEHPVEVADLSAPIRTLTGKACSPQA